MGDDPFGRSEPRGGSRPVAPRKGLRVLVVDDEAAVREIVALLLSEEGYTVGTAKNGPDALEKFAAARWDVVITDRAMPEMNGDELAARIKHTSPEIPVIMVTGFAGPLDPVGPFAKAIDLVVKKPFTISGLRTAIETVTATKAGKTQKQNAFNAE